MNKKLLLTFVVAGTLFSSAFCISEEDAAAMAWFWKLFERKELRKPFSKDVVPKCILPKLVPDFVQVAIKAHQEYQECGQRAGDKSTCTKQRKMAIKFHEALRPMMEECAVAERPPIGSVDPETARYVCAFWSNDENTEFNKDSSEFVVDPHCTLDKLFPDMVDGHAQATLDYTECKARKSYPCDKQRENLRNFHELLRPVMTQCAVGKTSTEKKTGWFGFW